MTCKIFSPIILLFAVLAMATNVNAGIVALYDATTEILPQPNAGDQTDSVINTSSTNNGEYNTRSIAIGGSSTPHLSGIIPSSGAANGNGQFYVQSAATLDNHNIVAPSAAWHEFSIAVNNNQLNLDTLSFNYWATEGAVNDSESDTDYTYSVRAHAEVIGANGSSGFQNLATVISGNDSLRIQNTVNNALPLSTLRTNVVSFDLSQLSTLDVNDVVNFRLSFSDETTSLTSPFSPNGGLAGPGPSDNSHIHRLDNVQLEATTVSAVPEPSALCLLLGSFGILGLRRRR